MQYDEQKVQDFMERMVGEFGAVASAPLIALGDRLGLYKAMTEQGWMTSEQIAERAGLAERYVREWLAAQAASGFIRYDPDTARYQLENEMVAGGVGIVADEARCGLIRYDPDTARYQLENEMAMSGS